MAYTWGEYKDAVRNLLTVDKDRQGVQVFIDMFIRLAVIDLQDKIPCYRVGHETTLTDLDVTDYGESSLGTLPEGANIQELYLVLVEENPEGCKRVTPDMLQWKDRHLLKCLDENCNVHRAKLALDHKANEFVIYPKLESGVYELLLVYDGEKLDFDDADNVPFDEKSTEAVMAYVKANLELQMSEKQIYDTWMNVYKELRLDLWQMCKDRRNLKTNGIV